MKRIFLPLLVAVFLISCGDDLTTKVIAVYPNDAKKSEADFKDGVKVAQRNYRESGQLFEKGPMKDNMREGVWTFYDSNGKLQSKRSYSKGKYHGEYQEFHKNGKLKLIGTYVNGEKQDDWRTYAENGSEIKKDQKDFNFKEAQSDTEKDGKENNKSEVLERFENGQIKAEMIKNPDGSFNEQINYYDTGELMLKGKYKNNLKDGQWVSYYKDGKIQSINNYLEDKFHGDYMLYYESGAVKIEGEYNFGNQTGEWKSYGEKGKLLTHRYYDQNGEMIEKIK